ncbi:MAG: M48 family metallopeptidase [Alphaproteobacteria bacterium]
MRMVRLTFAVILTLLLTSLIPVEAQAQRIQVLRDAEIESGLRELSLPLFRAAGLDPDSVRIVLVNDRSLNAFVAGGANIFIHSGLIAATDNPEELAGVLAHEMGHITGGHLVRLQMELRDLSTVALLTSVVGVAGAVLAGDPGAVVAGSAAGGQIGQRTLLRYSRQHEGAADQAALGFLQQAGYPATGLLSVFGKLADQELLPESQQVEFVRSHPLTRSRIAALDAYVRRTPAAQGKMPDRTIIRHSLMRAKVIGFTEPQRAAIFYRDADSIPARYARAIADYRRGRTDQALEGLASLRADYPLNPWFHETHGQFLYELGQVEKAEQAYGKAIELEPGANLARLGWGRTLLDTGKLQQAREQLTRVTSEDRMIPLAWRLLATAEGRLGNEAAAQLALAEESLLRRNWPRARANAEAAARNSKTGSPQWLRAQDVISAARQGMDR